MAAEITTNLMGEWIKDLIFQIALPIPIKWIIIIKVKILVLITRWLIGQIA